MQYPTAEQVSSAMSVNLPINELNYLGSVLQQKQQQQILDRKERNANAFAGIGIIDDSLDPLAKGTGYSPYDELTTTQIGDIRDRAMQMALNGADPATLSLYVHGATNGLKARQTQVIDGISKADAVAKAVSAKDPAYDYPAMRQQYIDNIFTTKDAKTGARVFNPNFNVGADFTSGAIPIYDPIKKKELALKEFSSLFPEREAPLVSDRKMPLIRYTANIPSYLTIDASTQRTVLDTSPLEVKNTDGKMVKMDVVSGAVTDKLFASPQVSRYLDDYVTQIKPFLPPDVSPDAERRIAATSFIQENGIAPGGGVKEDYSAFDRQRLADNDAFNRSMRLRVDGRAAQAANRASKRAANNALNTPFGIASMAMVRENDPNTGRPVRSNPEQYSQLSNYAETVTLPKTQPFVGYNINAFAGKEKDALYVDGKPARVYLSEDGPNGTAMVVQYLNKVATKSKRRGDDGLETITDGGWVPSGEAKIYHGANFISAWNRLSPQLGLKSDKYNNAINEPTSPDDYYPFSE